MSMSGKRILLIEDDRAIGRVLRDNLQYDGFSVEWLQTGRGVDATAKRFNPAPRRTRIRMWSQ